MATCLNCKKELGFLSDNPPLWNGTTEKLCTKCLRTFELAVEKPSVEELESQKEKLVKKGFTEEGLAHLREYCEYMDAQRKLEEKEFEERAQSEESFYASDNTPQQPMSSVNDNMGPFEGQDLVYKVVGVRGRTLYVYTDKIVINTDVTIGSIISKNATDGEKTVYYVDCVGIQYKQAGVLLGFLQLETAAALGNNKDSNFFTENSFTFDNSVITNERMLEVCDFIKAKIDAIKKASSPITNFSVADELLKFKQLLDAGVITKEEFDIQKEKLLNK